MLVDKIRKLRSHDQDITATARRVDTSTGELMPPDPVMIKAHTNVMDRQVIYAKELDKLVRKVGRE